MIFLLLLILALLIWAIQAELDGFSREPIQVVGVCPGCKALVEPEWLVCPHCRERLSESCSCCHKSKLLSHAHCPYCGFFSKQVAA